MFVFKNLRLKCNYAVIVLRRIRVVSTWFLGRGGAMSKREEEYLEAMYLLLKEKGVIRIKDLATKLNVRPSSVVEYLNKLAKRGLVHYEKHESITLTEFGLNIAKKVYQRHEALRKFLTRILELSSDVAERDACYIEHGVHDITINRIVELMKFLENNPQIFSEWKKHLSKMKTT